ncbi:hypothetical protein C8F01DRAFT_1255473 [Mycena amicta]|nr:hypothetical protein C8F01DRAFT_1255473 [Mycena amicta]
MADVDDDPHLPRELEREIFELAAELWPPDVPPLLRVAKRVLEWLRPHLFTTLSIQPHSPSLRALLHLLATDPSFCDPRSVAARSVFVGHTRWLSNEAIFVLRTFGKSVKDLTMMSASRAVVPLFGGPTGIQVERLAISLAHLSEGGGYKVLENLALCASDAFAQLTHLELFDFLHGEPQQAWTYLFSSNLPSLSHLCLHSFVHRAQLLALLDTTHCRCLQILINVHQNTEPEWGLADIAARLAITGDVRFVLMTIEVSLGAHARRWEAARRGRGRGEMQPRDFWSRAEAFVEARREGRVLPATRCWITDEDGLV